ncbi:S-adenosylhomocysteine hydrolase [Actinopolyspora biskrensis]|uniref:S-adenosylhomocysteine hydrolase n=1 Tax=Actinopolyspora biskrensis TaxID=1470178 RepID=A0A852Z9D7_9ACTN|nr:hypothetical protein [Actinopolyspora biskrensis]NYH80156.1 S-adenosylhomocysteine hydrolase [Actinopolyspora biskrensis]
MFGWSDAVLGATGHRSFTADDVEHVRDGAVLAGGSPNKVEFDVEGIRSNCASKREDDIVSELMLDGNTVYVLNDGEPINFLEQSALGNALELIRSELCMCMWALATQRHRNGIHRLAPELQQWLADTWRCAHRNTP